MKEMRPHGLVRFGSIIMVEPMLTTLLLGQIESNMPKSVQAFIPPKLGGEYLVLQWVPRRVFLRFHLSSRPYLAIMMLYLYVCT